VILRRTLHRATSRRDVLAALGAASAFAASFSAGFGRARAEPAPSGYSPQFETALRKITGDTVPDESGIMVDLPEIAENGNIVPYKLDVDSPMTDADHVQRLHLLSTANPQAAVATFHFTPQSGKAMVSGRMRLAKTQDVVAVAVTSGGKMLIGKRNIMVTIGGCGSE
jgi:sulfur-oxidizing protein SoxY